MNIGTTGAIFTLVAVAATAVALYLTYREYARARASGKSFGLRETLGKRILIALLALATLAVTIYLFSLS